MKISVNDQELLTLSETKKKVICDQLYADELEADLKRRIEWVLMHKYEQCFKRLKEEWDPKLAANGIEMIPTHPDLYAELVFSQPNYKDRRAREQDVVAKEQI